MKNALPKNNLIATEKAIEAAVAAISLVKRVPAPSGCRVRICAGTTSRLSGPLRTTADRAPSGSAMRSALPAQRQANGVPSAWSQPSPLPMGDHADGATLGRHRGTAAQKVGDEDCIRSSVSVAARCRRSRFADRCPLSAAPVDPMVRRWVARGDPEGRS